MKVATAHLRSVSPYSQSRAHNEPHLNGGKESHEAYEKRTWLHKAHVTSEGQVFIPPMAFKNCLSDAAKYMSERIPGKGMKTWTQKFASGVLVMDPLVLPVKWPDEIQGEELFVNADGRPGSGTRVWRTFPVFHEWRGEVPFYVLDETITQDVFIHHLQEAGSFIGIGRFRPQNRGFYGRFEVEKVGWQ